MKERPILMNGPMVRATLEGRKTQTRRIMKTQLVYGDVCGLFESWYLPTSATGGTLWPNGRDQIIADCPHGQPGDRLWVRENYRLRRQSLQGAPMDGVAPSLFTDSTRWFESDGEAPVEFGKIRPSIHMPRWASRILLEIASVRVERLNDCSESDAIAEGIIPVPKIRPEDLNERQFWRDYRLSGDGTFCVRDPIDSYRSLWESINGAGSWAANPWVWAVEFRRLP